ncbi:hypothetical protein G6F62_014164 [Rhizopus arrhizus]|nr:hypothetical protein G6F62_014164 [Rhizopus arrhizus]
MSARASRSSRLAAARALPSASLYADLGADVAVADDAQRLTAYFVAAAGRLRPAAAMAFGVLLRDATGQHDRLGDHQLGHAAGVGIGGVEYRDAGQLGRVQVDLVGADAEAAHCDQPLGLGQHLGAELVRPRAAPWCALRSGCSRRR